MENIKSIVEKFKSEIVEDKISLENAYEYYEKFFEDIEGIDDEYDLEEELSKTEEGKDALREMINHLYSYNCKEFTKKLWINDEIQAGEIMAHNMATVDPKDVALYAKLVSSMDLDHEVNQCEDTMELLEKWGFNRDTYPLIVGRIINFGQHGDELLEELQEDIIEALEENDDYDYFLNLLLDTIRNHESSHCRNFDFNEEAYDMAFGILFEVPSEYNGDEFEDEEGFSKFVSAFVDAGKNNKEVKYAELIELDK